VVKLLQDPFQWLQTLRDLKVGGGETCRFYVCADRAGDAGRDEEYLDFGEGKDGLTGIPYCRGEAAPFVWSGGRGRGRCVDTMVLESDECSTGAHCLAQTAAVPAAMVLYVETGVMEGTS
jgi:hypothetical protein